MLKKKREDKNSRIEVKEEGMSGEDENRII